MRIAVVVQRFGEEIRGGAETHARLVAELLSDAHEVSVLTSTAGDYQTWAEAYPPGASRTGRLRLLRFPVRRGRAASWPVMHELLHEGFEASEFAWLGVAAREELAARVRAWPDPLQEEFLRSQGPICPELHDELRAGGYDRVLFFTYLYPTTIDGLLAVPPERALLIPTLHDEPPAYLPLVGRRLERAELLCSTDAEIALAARLYPGRRLRARRIGYGIPLPAADSSPGAREPFLLYLGRIDAHKGVAQLLEWYRALRSLLARAPALRLVGEPAMRIAAEPGVEPIGAVSEEEKDRLLRSALALVHPSPYESLGIVLLEAMARETPLIVNAASEVMVEHCRRSGAGVWVRDGAELAVAVERLLREAAFGRRLGRRGRVHVEREYGLDAYRGRLLEVFPP